MKGKVMKPVSTSLFAFSLALTLGTTFMPAQAEIRMSSEFPSEHSTDARKLAMSIAVAPASDVQTPTQYPTQHVIDVRKIVADQSINHRGYYMAMVDSKIDAIVMFKSGSDKLTKEGEAEVAKAATLIKGTGKHIIVEGNTDSSGKAARNQDLSYRRALRVMTTLVRKYGIPASALTAKGYGSSVPVATNSTATGRAANRRVSFTVAEPGNT
jgi:outer membrane protein OmpA-like peptidoglycan-associated protein